LAREEWLRLCHWEGSSRSSDGKSKNKLHCSGARLNLSRISKRMGGRLALFYLYSPFSWDQQPTRLFVSRGSENIHEIVEMLIKLHGSLVPVIKTVRIIIVPREG
jgi:hypothetical protein